MIKNDCTAAGGNDTTLSHELGHYFDLYHTHETSFGTECPSGSNCQSAGDMVCDTPADPNLGQTRDDVHLRLRWIGVDLRWAAL